MLQIYLSTSIALLSHFHVEKKCGLVGVVLDVSSACKNLCLSVDCLLSMFLYFFNLGRCVPPADICIWFASVLACVFWRSSIRTKMFGCAWLRCFFLSFRAIPLCGCWYVDPRCRNGSIADGCFLLPNTL